MQANQEKIIQQVTDERLLQDERWGGAEHDDSHRIEDFCTYIQKHNERAFTEVGQDQRYAFVRVAALAIAAVESFDRRHKS